jgi:hypothetical protein
LNSRLKKKRKRLKKGKKMPREMIRKLKTKMIHGPKHLEIRFQAFLAIKKKTAKNLLTKKIIKRTRKKKQEIKRKRKMIKRKKKKRKRRKRRQKRKKKNPKSQKLFK